MTTTSSVRSTSGASQVPGVQADPRDAHADDSGGSDHERRPPLYVWLFVATVVAQAFSGSWDRYGSPVPLDRLLLAAALVAFAVHPDTRRLRWGIRPLHVLMIVVLATCVVSITMTGGLRDAPTLFAFLDSFGAVPFLLFVLAPVVLRTPARRALFAGGLTWLGLYIGWVSVAEGLRLHFLVFPATILEPEHTHFERALGPSLQVGSNGLALLGCLAFAGAYAVMSTGVRRWIGAVSLALCTAGVFFTLTRSMWLALVVGAGAVVLADRRLVRPAVLLGVAGIAGLVLVAVAAPAVMDAAFARAETSRSVYDRFNANAAAVRVVADRPLTGVGFQRFHEVERDWVRQADDYPVTNMGIDVHNVLLGHAAELGLVVTLAWTVVLVAAVVGAARGPRTPEMRVFRVAVLFYGLAWFTVSMLVPIKYALPTTLLWVGLGVLTHPSRLGWEDDPPVSTTGGPAVSDTIDVTPASEESPV